MKILCMCQGGNSRSVGLSFILRYEYGHDALPCGWEKNSSETLKMLFDWAEIIIVMQEKFKLYVPKEYWKKLAIVDVGEDKWCNGLHPNLLDTCRVLLKDGLKVGVQDELEVNATTVG